MNDPVARLAKIPPRDVWKNEAYDFTPWLADNLDQLGEVLGMDLEFVEREAAVGEFSADIVARDLNGDRIVIIENQLAPTDHGHLGQVITYAAGFEAAVVVWISPEMREEHRQALDWLNRRTDEGTEIFGVVVEVLRIDNSRPAANFRLAAFPNTWSRQAKASAAKAEPLSAKGAAYREFFQAFIDELRTKHRFTSARVAHPQSYFGFPTGISGISYNTGFGRGEKFRVEFYIDVGDAERNGAIYDALAAEKEQIERDLGAPLSWEPMEGKRARRIALYRDRSSIMETSQDELLAWAVDKLLKFREAFGARLRGAVSQASKVIVEKPDAPTASETG